MEAALRGYPIETQSQLAGVGNSKVISGTPLKVTSEHPKLAAPLSTKAQGWKGVVVESAANDQIERDGPVLRAMGLRPAAKVRVCRVGEPTIVEVVGGVGETCRCGCRIGLCRELAAKVMVRAEGEEPGQHPGQQPGHERKQP